MTSRTLAACFVGIILALIILSAATILFIQAIA
ncbi:hypothetical protein L332_07265 [Agrococcus pavilionensis RW1]|jgi:hypothetical protein|uniref:Uncharacterized protein n=1 Tax=Agrococcus pavilionensis RW1 TaxID=1330458 RepID=U1MUB9_9MICO|nr:hypothetical protein L332_07265 [Agrococcus pavilionensis RW1]CDK00501.1 exported hypothetical protein [Microbacterium sp. C448]